MRYGKRSGSILLVVLLITVVIASLGVAYISTTVMQQRQVSAYIDSQAIYTAALSGIDIARSYLYKKYTAPTIDIYDGWDVELAKSNANSATYIADIDSNTPLNPGNYTYEFSTWFQWSRNMDFYGITYLVQLENNDDGGGDDNDTDGIVNLTVHAWSGGNEASRRSEEMVLRAIVGYAVDRYTPEYAIVSGGSTRLVGVNVGLGNGNAIEANGPVDFSAATVPGKVTSTGAIVPQRPTDLPSASKRNIPTIVPASYAYLTTYTLKGGIYGGQVWLTGGGKITDILPFKGWTWNGNMWRYAGNFPINDANDSFYSETNVEIYGSFGTFANPWSLTLLSAGYIDVTGQPSIKALAGGISLMAGTDLRLRGPSNIYEWGLYAAREQIQLEDNPVIHGVLLAADIEDIGILIGRATNANMDYVGNISISYDGNLTTELIDGTPYVKIFGFKKDFTPNE